LDVETLASYCEAYDQFVDACEHLRAEGYVVKGYGGEMKRNPWLMVQNQAVEKMLKIGALFGMSPSDRMRFATRVNPPRRNTPTHDLPEDDLPSPHATGDKMGGFIGSKPQAPGTKH